MSLPKKRITKALIRLRGCAGWSAPVLFANPRRQVFSRCGPFDVNLTIMTVIINYQLKQADGPISIETSESVNYVIQVLLVMNFTMLWNVVSLTLIGKSLCHISIRKQLTASHIQIYLMILTPGG